MAYFSINLPNNIYGEVRCGKVSKLEKPLFKLFTPWRNSNNESKTGYIIRLKSAFVNETEYRLFKTKEGHWSQDVEGKMEVEEPLAKAIKKAIEEHEKTSK